MDATDIRLNRLYDDLAYLWPLLSPPEEYAEEAGHWRSTLREDDQDYVLLVGRFQQ